MTGGARLRLRPKVITVATIVASLLPIMWSHRQGAEVMKPLAKSCCKKCRKPFDKDPAKYLKKLEEK